MLHSAEKAYWVIRNAPVLPLFRRCLLFWQKAGMAQTIRVAHFRIPLVMISARGMRAGSSI